VALKFEGFLFGDDCTLFSSLASNSASASVLKFVWLQYHNIKTFPQEDGREGVNFIHLAQDMDEWKALTTRFYKMRGSASPGEKYKCDIGA
jgi:hypothetical protein